MVKTVLAESLESESKEVREIAGACLNLNEEEPSEEVIKKLIKMMNDKSPKLTHFVPFILSKANDKSIVEPLIMRLENPNINVSCAYALVASAKNNLLDDNIMSKLIDRYDKETNLEFKKALISIYGYTSNAKAKKILLSAIEDKETMYNAVYSIRTPVWAGTKDDDFIKSLLNLLDKYPDATYIYGALENLTGQQIKRNLDAWKEWWKNEVK